MSDPAPVNSLQTLSHALADVVADAAKSVVAVHASRSRSSGFVWRPGLIVTADEALADEGEIAVMSPGGEAVGATLVGRDSTTDIALLRVDGFAAPVASLQSTPMRAGALALAVGAGRNGPIAAFGAVSSAGPAWRSLRGGEIDARVELDLSLRRAGEGGLALDASGQAFGMAVFGPRRTVLVIPAATIERVAGKLLSHGRIARGYIGLGLQAAKLDGDGGIGAMAMSVDPTGPAAAAGVRQGDLIVKWNGERIRDVRTLLRALGPDSVGQTARLSLLRGGEPVEVALTIAERPET
jgi:S1-C subfamily serine protease